MKLYRFVSVLVPALLLGGAFLSAAVWGESTETRPVALGLGLALMAAGFSLISFGLAMMALPYSFTPKSA